MNKFLFYFLLFFIYSILGWIIESIYCSLNDKKFVLNRGFLIGPYLPIYGSAAVLMVLFLSEYKNNIFVLFSMCTIYSSILEYITSYVMEKVFRARWWDYSDKDININGRICLSNALLFGLCGIFLIYIVHPAIEYLLDLVAVNFLNNISFIILLIVLIDFILSTIIVLSLKIKVRNIKKDSTEEIDKQVRERLSKINIFNKRLFKAFPKLSFTYDKSGIVITSIKARMNELDKELIDRKEEIKNIKLNIKDIRKNSKDKSKIKIEKDKIKNIRRNK